jgi:hypothetical protein
LIDCIYDHIYRCVVLCCVVLWIDGLAKEQVRRRAREWSIRTLKTHREAVIREENEEADRLRQEEIDRRKVEEEETRNRILNEAMSVDADWVAQEKHTQDVRSKTKFDMAELKWMPKFDLNNPATAEREHKYSWKLKSFGGRNGDLPIEPQASVQVRSLLRCSLCESIWHSVHHVYDI